MAPHSSTLVWRIPWTEEPGRLQSMGSLESDKTERLPFHFSLSCIGEGTGNPLQCSCLENPRDRGAWWATISGVAQSRTRLKQLSSRSSSKAICLIMFYLSYYLFGKNGGDCRDKKKMMFQWKTMTQLYGYWTLVLFTIIEVLLFTCESKWIPNSFRF